MHARVGLAGTWLAELNGKRLLPMSRKVASTAVQVGGAGGAVPLAVLPGKRQAPVRPGVHTGRGMCSCFFEMIRSD